MTARYVVTLEKLCDCGRTVARGVIGTIRDDTFDAPIPGREAAYMALSYKRISEHENGDAVVACERELCDVCVTAKGIT